MPWPFRQPTTYVGRVQGIFDTTHPEKSAILAQKNGYRAADLGAKPGCANCCCLCKGYDIVIEGVSMIGCFTFPAQLATAKSAKNHGTINGKWFLPQAAGSFPCTSQCGNLGFEMGCNNWDFYESATCVGCTTPQGVNFLQWTAPCTYVFDPLLGPGGRAWPTTSPMIMNLQIQTTCTSLETEPTQVSFSITQWFQGGHTGQCGDVAGNFIQLMIYFQASIQDQGYFDPFDLTDPTRPKLLCGQRNRCRDPLVLSNTTPLLGRDPMTGIWYGGTGGTVSITQKF